MVLNKSIIQKYNSKVIKTDDSCWDWNGAKDKDGYGTLWDTVDQKTYKAHRVAYVLFNLDNMSDIPENMEVCHSCDNPSCSNPDHLFISSHKGNMKDAVSKNKFNNRDGESNNNAILTNDIVYNFIQAVIECKITSDNYLKYFPEITKSMYWKIFRKEQWTTISEKFDEHAFMNGKYYFYHKYTFDQLNELKNFIKTYPNTSIKDIINKFKNPGFTKYKVSRIKRKVLDEMV